MVGMRWGYYSSQILLFGGALAGTWDARQRRRQAGVLRQLNMEGLLGPSIEPEAVHGAGGGATVHPFVKKLPDLLPQSEPRR